MCKVEITSLYTKELKELGLLGKTRIFLKNTGDFLAVTARENESFVVYLDPRVLKSRVLRRYARYLIRHEFLHVLDILSGKYGTDFKKTGVPLLDECIEQLYLAYTDLIADREYVKVFGEDDIMLLVELSYNMAKNLLREEVSWQTFFRSLKYAVSCLLYSEGRIKRSKTLRRLYNLYQMLYKDLLLIERSDGDWSFKSNLLVTEALAVLSLVDLKRTWEEKTVVFRENWGEFMLIAEHLELTGEDNFFIKIWASRI